MSVPTMPGGWLPNSGGMPNSFAPDTPMHGFDPVVGGMLSQPGVDPNHVPQSHPHMQNGNSRNSSPGFQPQSYSVTPVVPLKRPRPREDSINSISPRPAQQGLPTSRSQTPLSQNPQLAYQLYQSNNQQPQQPRQYTYNASHLQHVGSTNASPSPVMQDQSFQNSANSAPKRVATQSPSPFSPAPSQQGFMPQGSPPPNHGSRAETPQNGNGIAPPPYSQPYTQGYQSPAPTTSASPAPGPGQAMPQNQMQAQMVYTQVQRQQARMMQQQQQQQQQGQNMVNQSMPMNSISMLSPANPNSMSGPGAVRNQMPRPQQQGPPQGHRVPDPMQFDKSLREFMLKKGTPIRTIPVVGNRQVDLFRLYGSVIKAGGSHRVTGENRWQQLAISLGFPPNEFSLGADELAAVFKEYLSSYEEAWMRNQQDSRRKQLAMQGRTGQSSQQQAQRPVSNGPMQMPQTPRTPSNLSRPQPSMPSSQGLPAPPNGYTQPQQRSQIPPSTPTMPALDATPPAAPQSFSLTKPAGDMTDALFQTPATPKEAVTDFKPKVRVLDSYGGLNIGVMSQIGADLAYHRPIAPSYHELGLIDIHAIIMQLKSGLPGEIRVALDALATVSVEARQSIALESCDDLLDALVDVAEAQVEFLGEHAPDGFESITMLAYEDVVRACRAERDSLPEVARYGTVENDLERAADRLLCITTILRNLSFFESNHNVLASPTVVRFVSSVIERLGTCSLFLRSYRNLLDFMKDIIIYLSNNAHAIALPSEDEALNLLHLVLAFSPQPLPYASGHENLMFTSYSPAIHRYLPPAIDTLAKLLARDEPNRAFYKAIYLSETNTSPQYDLLIRSFALAISPIPDNNRTITQAVELRRPILEQGLLVADILSQVAPGGEKSVARAWLCSEDGFALSLLRLVCLLSPQANLIPQRGQKISSQEDPYPFSRITHRGMNVLRRLAAKSGGPDEEAKLPQSLLPKKESLLGALLTIPIDGAIVRELCAYAGLDD